MFGETMVQSNFQKTSSFLKIEKLKPPGCPIYFLRDRLTNLGCTMALFGESGLKMMDLSRFLKGR